MRRTGLRFDPPAQTLTPEVRWVLLAAFAATPGPSPGSSSGFDSGVLPAAQRLGLVARIAARLGAAGLAKHLGPELAGELAAQRATIVARSLLLRQAALDIARIAATAPIPIVFLKFAALDAGGYLREGSRPAGDVDVLAPAERGEELSALLRANGFEQLPVPGYEHHLPALRGPHGIVEIHRVVLGVRLGAGRASATLEQLATAGLLRSVALPADPATTCSIPVPEALVAHALAHGLGQHGFSPRAYPLATLFADLQDLGFASGAAPAANLEHWLRHTLRTAEIEATRGLLAALTAGAEPEGSARVLLHHVVAGTFDPDYRAVLKVRQFRYPLSDRLPLVAILAGGWTALRGGGQGPDSARRAARPGRWLGLLQEVRRGVRRRAPRSRSAGAKPPDEL